MKEHAGKLALLAVLVGIAVALRFTPLGQGLTLENLQQNRDALLAAVRDAPALSFAVFIALYVVVTAFSIPGATVMTLAGGYLFGTLAAVLCVNAGATTGAVLAFLSARYLLGSRLQERYAQQLAKFNAEMEQNGPRYLLTVRLLPIFPFFLVNFLSGLTRVPLATFAWTTAVGIVPGSFVYSFAGHQLESVHSLRDILSTRILMALVVLAAFTLLPALWPRIRAALKK